MILSNHSVRRLRVGDLAVRSGVERKDSIGTLGPDLEEQGKGGIQKYVESGIAL